MIHYRFPHLITILVTALGICVMLSAPASSAKPVPISTHKIDHGVYFITGKSGNLGVSIGKDGTILINNQSAGMSDVILQEIKAIGGEQPNYIINTHWHKGHTEESLRFGKFDSVIVSHSHANKNLMKDTSKQALTYITFSAEIEFSFNGEFIKVQHAPNAHTYGDCIIFFKNSNILHTGDLFYNSFYPLIDSAQGGSLRGMIDAADHMLSLIDEETIIIPGHGPLADKKDLYAYRNMLYFAYNTLSKLKKSGKSLEEAITEKPLTDIDTRWANGPLSSDEWISTIYPHL